MTHAHDEDENMLGATLKSSPVESVAVKGDLAAEIGARIEELLSEERQGAFIGVHQVRAIQEIEARIRSAPLSNPEAPAAPIALGLTFDAKLEFMRIRDAIVNSDDNEAFAIADGAVSRCPPFAGTVEAPAAPVGAIAGIERRHIQALGASLSRRDWCATDVAYNNILYHFETAEQLRRPLRAALVATPPAPTSAVDGELVTVLREALEVARDSVITGCDTIKTLGKINAALSAPADPAAMGRAGDLERLHDVVEKAQWARKRLQEFADQANAGKAQAGGRELSRKIWGAFSDFDAAVAGHPSHTAGGEEKL